MIRRLQRQDALKELQTQCHVGLHVFDGVERRADAIGRCLVEVGGGLIPLLWKQNTVVMETTVSYIF